MKINTVKGYRGFSLCIIRVKTLCITKKYFYVNKANAAAFALIYK